MIRRATGLLGLILLLPACATAPSTAPSATAAASAGTVTCDYRATSTPAKAVDPPTGTNVPATGTQEITLVFADGPVTITLDQALAPCTTHSFESLAAQDFFTGSRCHRLTADPKLSVLQCGDPSGLGTGGPGYWFDDELSSRPTYTAGTVAMANGGANTNGSQFFMVYEDSELEPNYTVFGRTDAQGLAVLRAIAAKGLTPVNNPADGIPLADTRITEVTQG